MRDLELLDALLFDTIVEQEGAAFAASYRKMIDSPTLLDGATTVTGTAAATQLNSALDVVLPDLRPRPSSVIALASGVAPPVTGIVEAVSYLGAVAPPASAGKFDSRCLSTLAPSRPACMASISMTFSWTFQA
jgi:hypothetical protein